MEAVTPLSELDTAIIIAELRARGYYAKLIEEVEKDSIATALGFLNYLREELKVEVQAGRSFIGLMDALCDAYPEPASYERIVDCMYANRWDGGPLTAKRIVMVQVCNMRKMLKDTPYWIENIWGFGYRLIRVGKP